MKHLNMVGQIDRMMLLRKDNTDYRINFDPVTTFQVEVAERLLQVIFIGLLDHTSVISNRPMGCSFPGHFQYRCRYIWPALKSLLNSLLAVFKLLQK